MIILHLFYDGDNTFDCIVAVFQIWKNGPGISVLDHHSELVKFYIKFYRAVSKISCTRKTNGLILYSQTDAHLEFEL